TPMAARRPVGPGDRILVEGEAKWCGYLSHGAMTKWVGKPDETARAMAELQYEATQRCWEAMRPGRTLGELVDVCAKVAARSPFECKPIVHSRGHGLDSPVLVFHARDERTKNWVIEENSVFIMKSMVSTPNGDRRMMWGDSVVVTPNGARRLGKRPVPLVQSNC
ncbi:MAG: M24 family metallopeptidase, partial [Steroidobacteraceae bacterium]